MISSRALSWWPVTAPARSAKQGSEKVGPADALLTGVVLALVAFGVVMVYSASAVFASQSYGNGYLFLVRQSIFAGAGLFVMVAAAHVDYRRYRHFTYAMLAVSVILLLLVVLGFGRNAGGATRWLSFGPINVQPAEVTKVALIFWLAYSLSKKRDKIRSFSVGFLPHMLVALVLMLLCLRQPDFGSAVMIALLTFVLLFAAGAKTGYLLGAALCALPVAYALVTTSPYRMRRIQAFLDPFAHRYDVGYQIAESLMSFGAGARPEWGSVIAGRSSFSFPKHIPTLSVRLWARSLASLASCCC